MLMKKQGRKGNLHSFLQRSTCTISAIVIGIALFASVEDDGFFLLMKPVRSVRGFINKQFYTTEVPNNETSAEVSYITKGIGLDLMLINNIQTEGFVKEFLNLLKDSEEGKLNDLDMHVPMETLLGTAVNEVGTYPQSHGMVQKSYLLWEGNAPLWGVAKYGIAADGMTLRGMGEKEYQALASAGKATDLGHDGTSKNIFQLTDNSDLGKAKIDGISNANRSSSGNTYYLPDQLYGEDLFIRQFAAYLPDNFMDDIDKLHFSFLFASSHNRGPTGALRYAFGVPYAQSGYLDTPEKEEYFTQSKALMNSLKKGEEVVQENINLSEFIDPENHRWIAVFMALNDGWSVNDAILSTVASGGVPVKCWNAVNPTQPVSSGSELKEKLRPSVRSLADTITQTTGETYTDSDVAKAYACTNDYKDVYNKSKIFIYKAEKERSSAYKNKVNGNAPFIVHAYDHINAGANFAGMFCGRYMYANMLKFSGVDVDPTNPSTYMKEIKIAVEKLEQPSQWMAGDTSWYSLYKIDQTKLTPDRIKILNEAYKYCGNTHTYVYGGTGTMCNNYTDVLKAWYPWLGNGRPAKKPKESICAPLYPFRAFDCSGYVSWVYKECGYDFGRMTTANFRAHQNNWEPIKLKDIKPGDVLVSGSHIVIYVSGSGTQLKDLIIMESPETDSFVHIGTHNTRSSVGDGNSNANYKALAYSKLDKPK